MKRKPDSSKSMAKYQRARLSKGNESNSALLHKSVNKIDKQPSTIKQLCWENTVTKVCTFKQIWKTKPVYSKEGGRKESC
ncbi:MAG TPA: hypothetical protein VE573_01800 [Nitrososphaeraceae archaeon]|nr:hypothetical protein [Nitrososphaeraceae archaeon]